MGTVANSNFGFKGTVSSAETPQVLGNGSLYSVVGKDALKVTAGGTGDRAVTVAAGDAWGDGVLSKWTTGDNTRTCAANTTLPTRWDTVVIRRTWTPAGSPTGTASLLILTGGSSAAIAAGRTTGRGVTTSDQPIALVPVPQNSATVGTPVDLRVWAGEGGGLVAENVAALQYLSGKGTTVRVGDVTYTRMEDGTGTLYWAASEASAAVTPGSGWTTVGTPEYAPRVTRVGRQVFLHGAVKRGTGSGSSLATIPAGFVPPSTGSRPVGVSVLSNGQFTGLVLTGSTLSSGVGYGNFNPGTGVVVPIVATWWLD